ncbi:MAG: hypothetical protein Kow0099_26440 [Candidatus Abyssubacteria bacterium]
MTKNYELWTRNYELLEQIGESRASRVFRAIHKPTSKILAIKVIPMQGEEKTGTRQYPEVQFHCPLDHKNILKCHDFFTDGKHGYLVTEYIDGFNLRQCIERHPVQITDENAWFNHSMDTARKICEGHIYLHEQKIVHGQIKPENILVSRELVGPYLMVYKEVKIADFALAGLAKGLFHPSSHVRGGDPKYMAPEQISKKRATFRSDVFSLGVTLYELFTGRHPWNGEAGRKELLTRMLSPKFRPAPPSHTVAALPVFLDTALMKMLEKEERKRHSTMAEVWLDLSKAGALRI